jgi:hypothetical protein
MDDIGRLAKGEGFGTQYPLGVGTRPVALPPYVIKTTDDLYMP